MKVSNIVEDPMVGLSEFLRFVAASMSLAHPCTIEFADGIARRKLTEMVVVDWLEPPVMANAKDPIHRWRRRHHAAVSGQW